MLFVIDRENAEMYTLPRRRELAGPGRAGCDRGLRGIADRGGGVPLPGLLRRGRRNRVRPRLRHREHRRRHTTVGRGRQRSRWVLLPLLLVSERLNRY